MRNKEQMLAVMLLFAIAANSTASAAVEVVSAEISLEDAPIAMYSYLDEEGYHNSEELYYTGTVSLHAKLSLDKDALLLKDDSLSGKSGRGEALIYKDGTLEYETGDKSWTGDEYPEVSESICGVNYFASPEEMGLQITIGDCEWKEIDSQVISLWSPTAEINEDSKATFLLLYGRSLDGESPEYALTPVCEGKGRLGLDVGVNDALYFGGSLDMLDSYGISFEPLSVVMAQLPDQSECDVNGFWWDIDLSSFPSDGGETETNGFLLTETSLQLPEETTGYVLLQKEENGKLFMIPCVSSDAVKVEEREKIPEEWIAGLDEDDYEKVLEIVEGQMDIQPSSYRLAGLIVPDDQERFVIEGRMDKTWKELFDEMGGEVFP